MIDSLPPELGWPAAIIALVAWFVIEVHHATPDPNPDAFTALDVLQLTGKYPHG